MVTTWDVYDTYASSSSVTKEAKSDESLIKVGKATGLSVSIDQKESEGSSVQASTITGKFL